MYYPEPAWCDPFVSEFGRYGLESGGCFDINSLEPSLEAAPIRASPSSGEEYDDSCHYYTLPPSRHEHYQNLAPNVAEQCDEDDRRGQKLVKKRRPKKDPHEPQKPVSAYALFFRDTQATIKGQNPNASFGQVSKIVAAMWDALDCDAKTNYKQRTETAKKDYLKQLAAYRANQISQGGGYGNGYMELMEEARRSPAVAAPLAAVVDAAKTEADRELGTRTLASLMAQPTAHVLTATTTLTLRNKPDYESDEHHHHHHHHHHQQQQQQHHQPTAWYQQPPQQCRRSAAATAASPHHIQQHFYPPPSASLPNSRPIASYQSV